jgi:uncharacterized membrane protein
MESTLTDQRMETLMGRLLQVGVLAAASLVAMGGVFYLLRHGQQPVAYATFLPEPLPLRHPSRLLHQLRRSGAQAMLVLGILVLLATPVCRVIFAVVSFAIERDRLYVVISGIVLAVLLFGIFHAA